jgi:hypothetical protein
VLDSAGHQFFLVLLPATSAPRLRGGNPFFHVPNCRASQLGRWRGRRGQRFFYDWAMKGTFDLSQQMRVIFTTYSASAEALTLRPSKIIFKLPETTATARVDRSRVVVNTKGSKPAGGFYIGSSARALKNKGAAFNHALFNTIIANC